MPADSCGCLMVGWSKIIKKAFFKIDCTCDMPKGAKEEKDFIRKNLQQGLDVDAVITLVEKEYGHRIS